MNIQIILQWIFRLFYIEYSDYFTMNIQIILQWIFRLFYNEYSDQEIDVCVLEHCNTSFDCVVKYKFNHPQNL